MDTFIAYFTSADVLSTTRESNSKLNQVFLEMLTQHKTKLSVAQYMDLFYFFNRLERGIAHLKSHDVNTALCFFEKLNIANFEINNEFTPYVEALNLYVDAYQCFFHKNMEPAAEYAEQSLNRILQLNHHEPLYMLSYIDLNIKLLPILFYMKDEESLAYDFSRFLRLFFTEHSVAVSDELKEITQLSDEHKRSWLFYILENLMYYANEHFKDNAEMLNSLLLSTLDNLFQQVEAVPAANSDIYTGLQMAYQLLKPGNVEEPGKLLADNIDEVKSCPEFLKQLLLRKYTDYLTTYAIDYSAHMNYANFISTLESYKVKFDDTYLQKGVAL